jgi:hypothetical protein
VTAEFGVQFPRIELSVELSPDGCFGIPLAAYRPSLEREPLTS